MTSSPAIPSSRKIVGYTGWNLVGLCAPMLAAFFSFPVLMRRLGPDRFGALSLVWLLVGYFSLLDLGMGRAMTKITADALSLSRHRELPRIFWTALSLMAALGLAGAAALFAAADWLATVRLSIPLPLQPEVRTAFVLSAVALPFTVTVTGLIGVLETHQRFRLINLVRIPVGCATFLAPVAVLPFSSSLVAVVAALLAVRLLEIAVYFAACLLCIPSLRCLPCPSCSMVRPLLTFGGWLTVSNLVLPVMLQIDRFIVGAVKSLANVSAYTIPSELVVRVLILPRAFVSALFPPLAMHFARRDGLADALFSRAVRLLFLVLFPPVLLLAAVAPEFLSLWLGASYDPVMARLLRIMLAGILLYALAYLAFSLLQSAGRPDRAARWHLAELPVFLLAAVLATRSWGVTGMAAAWSIRCLLDALVLFLLAHRHVPAARHGILRTAAFLLLVALAFLPVGLLHRGPLLRAGLAAAATLAILALAVPFLLLPAERASLRSRLASLLRRPRVRLALWTLAALTALLLAAAAWFFRPVTQTLHIALPSRSVGLQPHLPSPAPPAPIRLALVADLHSCRYGPHQSTLLRMLDDARPDLVLLGGDIFDDKLPDSNAQTFLRAAAAKYPCFYVSGNHEYWSRRIDEMKAFVRSCGIPVLEGDAVPVECNGRTLDVCGIDDPTYLPRETWLAQLDAATAAAHPDHLRILLTHRPERVDDYQNRGFDLVLAAHAHGGQMRLPGTTLAAFAPDQGFFPRYTSGLYTLPDGTPMVVTRGLAREATPLPRYFNHPQLLLLSLE